MDLELDAGTPLRTALHSVTGAPRFPKTPCHPSFRITAKSQLRLRSPLLRALLNLSRKTGRFEDCNNRERVRKGSKDYIFVARKFLVGKRRLSSPSFVVQRTIFVNAIRFLATSREGINIWSCACSAMLGQLHERRGPPWGICLRGQLARRVWGLQGYSEP